ncbi:MAG: T9SS type A sorting domain-containing protein [Bacteroidota bacterium]
MKKTVLYTGVFFLMVGIWLNGFSQVQIGGDIDGEAADDHSGFAIALSADGTRLAIGAPNNDGSGIDAGHVRVYDRVGSSWVQLGSDIDGEAIGDGSGGYLSLSADGTTLAIGAIRNDGNGSSAGHVRIYEFDGSSWTQKGNDIEGEFAGDFSGRVSLSADGKKVAIGSIGNDVVGTNAGHVRVFEYFAGNWIQIGTDIDGENALDNSGINLSLSEEGKYMAIGAHGNDGISGSNTGHVRVFELGGRSWTAFGGDLDSEAADDRFGNALAISADGSRMIVGGFLNDGNGSGAGHVRVFDLVGSTWVQVGSDLDGENADDGFGRSVTISGDGNRIAIGSIANDGNGTSSGHVRVFEWDGSTWMQLGADLDGEAAGDWSGGSIALSSAGDRLAVGAIANDGNGTSSGHVRVFEWNAGIWNQLGTDINGEAAGDWFGASVSLSGDGSRLAAGATLNDGNGTSSGHVRVFDLIAGTWTQIGSDLDGEAAGDNFGFSVSLSEDGKLLAVGATANDGAGSNAGHTRIYEYTGGSWGQLGADIDGETADDGFGFSVSLSSDGSWLAAGARFNDGNGTNAGHVRVFRLESGSWVQQGADIEGEAANDYSGWSVSISNEGRLARGAPFNDGNGSNAGHVQTYELIGGSWTQLGLDIEGGAAGDGLGFAVSLSADGKRLAAGAPFNDDIGTHSGKVHVYDWNGVSWLQVGSSIQGTSANSRFGYSLDLSSDGQTLLIGSRYTGAVGFAQLYEYSGSTWGQLGNTMTGETNGDLFGLNVALSGDANTYAVGAILNAGNGTEAGSVRVFEASPLPVHLLSFTARQENQQVFLRWTTSRETNNAGFQIERSMDKDHWLDAGFVEGEGNQVSRTDYQFVDLFPQDGINYYRLKQVDLDGSFFYSSIIAVQLSIQEDHVKLYPNPTTGIIYIPSISDAVVPIYSPTGKMLKKMRATSGRIDLTEFSSGVYVLHLHIRGEQTIQRIMKL